MAYRKINARLRYQHCREIGVRADYCIIQFRYAEDGWRTVATCHPASIALIQRDGIRAHAELLRTTSEGRI